MRSSFTVAIILLITLTSLSEEQTWNFDGDKWSGVRIHGTIESAKGVVGKSAVFDGVSAVEVNDSEELTKADAGFTFTAWVNPYRLNNQQQMIAAKNRYSLNERQWGVMIDKDNCFRLYVWQGKWVTAECDIPPKLGHWHLIGVVVRKDTAELWVNGKLGGNVAIPKLIPQTAAPITFGGVNDNGRIWQNFTGALDEIRLLDLPLNAKEMTVKYHPVDSTHEVPEEPKPYTLWTGPPIPKDVTQIPFVPKVKHRTIHQAAKRSYKFLHGAAIVHHNGTLFANWAASPLNENGPHETLRGRRSTDGGETWSDIEIIGPGFEGPERHSHGVLFEHSGELWTICARFGIGTPGRRFNGLQGEAFVLNEESNQWESRGIVMRNCWPYDQPVKMANGNYITGGQDKDGLPVVAISRGEDFTKWDTVLIPFDPRLKPSFAETTVWADGNKVTAVIRGGSNVAWIATSKDGGRTWSTAIGSNMPMPRAKAYYGKLNTGQLFLVSNLVNRDTLIISVSEPGKQTLSRMWRIRHGKSIPPRFKGNAKSKQWSYPYAYEHDGKLYVIYSIGKEDCGLSVIPVESLSH